MKMFCAVLCLFQVAFAIDGWFELGGADDITTSFDSEGIGVKISTDGNTIAVAPIKCSYEKVRAVDIDMLVPYEYFCSC